MKSIFKMIQKKEGGCARAVQILCTIAKRFGGMMHDF
jgi:hypothetical protein